MGAGGRSARVLGGESEEEEDGWRGFRQLKGEK